MNIDRDKRHKAFDYQVREKIEIIKPGGEVFISLKRSVLHSVSLDSCQ